MTQETKQVVTPQEALEWLAGLERTACGYPDAPRCWCDDGDCVCHSLDFVEVHGKVPVLDLREPCRGTPRNRSNSKQPGFTAGKHYSNINELCR